MFYERRFAKNAFELVISRSDQMDDYGFRFAEITLLQGRSLFKSVTFNDYQEFFWLVAKCLVKEVIFGHYVFV